MKYIHNYLDGSFCESTSFESKVGQDNYLSITDEQYEDLCKGKKILTNDNEIVDNPDYVEEQL